MPGIREHRFLLKAGIPEISDPGVHSLPRQNKMELRQCEQSYEIN